MIGIVLAFVWLGFGIIFGATAEAAFLSAAGFLYYWYWTWTIVAGLFVLLIAVAPLLAIGSAVGYLITESPIGKLLGLVTGSSVAGAISLLVFGRFLLRRTLLILGAYLLMTSGGVFLTVVIGVAFLIIGILWGKR